jgi:hypothetical protein
MGTVMEIYSTFLFSLDFKLQILFLSLIFLFFLTIFSIVSSESIIKYLIFNVIILDLIYNGQLILQIQSDIYYVLCVQSQAGFVLENYLKELFLMEGYAKIMGILGIYIGLFNSTLIIVEIIK